MPIPAKRPTRGFSLVELVVFIVVISLALAGVLAGINYAVRHSADPMVNIRAVELGQAYLEEILGKRYDERSAEGGTPRCGQTNPPAPACTGAGSLGPDAGEAGRSAYDDVDDYNGLNDSPPRDPLGAVRAGYEGYGVTVTVAYAGIELGLDQGAAKRITVDVASPLGQHFVFSAYRSDF